MSQQIEPTTIQFDIGNHAALVSVAADAPAEIALGSLGLTDPSAALLLIGGAGGLSQKIAAKLVPQFEQGIAPAVAGRALVVDGGTQSGVMAIMGAAAAQQTGQMQLLGIAPAGNVRIPGENSTEQAADSAPLDPNHTHFVLVEAEGWGSETKTMGRIIDYLASRAPGATLLVNGGPIARNELEHSARLGWPIFVLEGSGRLADEITVANRHPEKIADPDLVSILAWATILPFKLSDDPQRLRDRLQAVFEGKAS